MVVRVVITAYPTTGGTRGGTEVAVNEAVAVRQEVQQPGIAPQSAKTTGRKRLSYDRLSDTLFLEFYDKPRPAISVPAEDGDRDYFYFRLDPKTDETVGVQIEAFLAYAVGHDPHPWGGSSTRRSKV